MQLAQTSLPEFLNAPVQEVLVGVQFERITQIRNIDLGDLKNDFPEEFDCVDEVPSLSPQFEIFGGHNTSFGTLHFGMPTGGNIPRLWITSSSKVNLYQVQPDRLLFNWRKRVLNDEYPRFNVIEDYFEKGVKCYRNFLEKKSYNDPFNSSINQCEVTYVNHISGTEDIGKIFINWRNHPLTWSHPLEDISFQVRQLIHNDHGEPYARIIVIVAPTTALDGQSTLGLNITVRGRPLETTLTGVREFFAMAHKEIVLQFQNMTTPEMHQHWQKR